MRDGRTDSVPRAKNVGDAALQSPNALFRKTRFSRAFDSLAPHATRADAQSRCHVRHDRGHASPRCRALVRVQQVRRPRRRRAAGASAGERLADRPKRRFGEIFSRDRPFGRRRSARSRFGAPRRVRAFPRRSSDRDRPRLNALFSDPTASEGTDASFVRQEGGRRRRRAHLRRDPHPFRGAPHRPP